MGQLVMVRCHGPKGVGKVAWGTVVGGGPGRYMVRVDGSFPDGAGGANIYDNGEVVEFRRIDGFSVMAVRRTDR